jgi:lysophospholipase L1-like esterase
MMTKYLCTSLVVAVLAGRLAPGAIAAPSDPGTKSPRAPSASAARRAAMVPIEDNPQLPRVLLIGDSIAMGYTLPLRQLLAGKANVHYPKENCHTSRQILERLDEYLGDKPWNVIQFNCGIHDITLLNEAGRAVKAGERGKGQVPIDEYRENLGNIVSRLRQTRAALIWCATTPVADNLPHRQPAEIIRYNSVAKEVMLAQGIPITDLHKSITRRGNPKWEDGVHFTIEGCRELARDLAPAIEAALAQRSSTRAAGLATSSDRLATASTPSPGTSMKDRRKAAADRQRRLIFNNDGNEPSFLMKSASAKELLDLRTSALVGSHVDSIFYCTWNSGFGLFTHLSKVGQVFTTLEGRYAGNQMSALLKAGIDPLRVMVEFGKQHGIEVFWSMRMNDTHDGSTADYGPILFRTNHLKMTRPEYLLGTAKKRPKYGAWTAVDYGRPEIRNLAFRYLEEVCRDYDVEGVELDFFRHPVYFKSTSRGTPATEAERAAMTDLLRRIRLMADEVGQARGRPILIAVRCPDSVEYCRAMGLDLKYWLANDLLDLWMPAGYFQLNDWNYSVALAHRYGVKVYPSLDESRISDATAQAIRRTDLAYRGRAANVWGFGADGVYVFNFDDPLSPLWRQLGDAQVLAGLDKDYFASIRGAKNAAGGNLPYASYQTVEKLNPGNTKTVAPGSNVTARISVGEALSQAGPVKLKLRLQFKMAVNPQLLHVSCNNQALSLLGTNQTWVEYSVSPPVVHQVTNQVRVTLATNATQAIWTDLMLQVRH